ncbi:MAG: kelch repeat-containing protein [Planctomycetota bacterium]|nr:kelch repeat-containing protein [Planctomycetota bacterium]
MRNAIRFVSGSATLLFAASLVESMPAQAPDWTEFPTPGPTARFDTAMAHDSKRAQTVLFGGRDALGNAFGDTWEWDGSTWQTLAPIASPTPRRGHTMAFDSERDVTVLFGGRELGGFVGDTWEWDGAVWTLVASTGPSARAFHTMAYDSRRDVTVLHGGLDELGDTLGDTWEWDGVNWTQVATTGSTPAPRTHSALVYDIYRRVAVMHGGLDSLAFTLDDTWEWDGANWTEVSASGSGPGFRYRHAMTYNYHAGTTLLFGGQSVFGGSVLGDTWEWDGTAWTVATASASPLPRRDHAMAYDNRTGANVLFGGRETLSSVFSDTWEYSNVSTLSGSAVPYGAGCGTPVLQFEPVLGSEPVVGQTAQAMLSSIPQVSPSLGGSQAFVSIGWNDDFWGGVPLPLDMQSYGMSGCFLYQSGDEAADAVDFDPTMGPGTAVYNLPVPNYADLIGFDVYLQAWAYAPGQNAGNTILSQAITWTVGNQ